MARALSKADRGGVVTPLRIGLPDLGAILSAIPDAVIVLADRSRSMEVEDLVGTAGSAQSRDAALRSLAAAPTPFDAIGAEHRVQWYGFSDALAPLARDGGGVAVGDAVGDADG